MSQEYTFQATIVNAGGGGAFIRTPFDVKQIFGKKRVPVSGSKEHMRAILDTGREETRRNRITKAIQMLLQKPKDF